MHSAPRKNGVCQLVTLKILQPMTKTKAKPFLKWAGGKTQLLPTIDSYLPESFRRERDVTYIEPFVGGGAMLFSMLQRYSNIRRAIINDINSRLINAYVVVRDNPGALIELLGEIQATYRTLADNEAQKEFFLAIRADFNRKELTDVEKAAYMIFLNRTCFNGLYRENSRGDFNVPFGRYANPTICDHELIMADSELLQKVEIREGDFAETEEYVDGYTLFYFDPPYRPLNATSNFNSYVKVAFDDSEQIRLKDFYTYLSARGCHAILSNSDGRSRDSENVFFDELYRDYIIERVQAKRSINSNPTRRGVLTELLIRNYADCQGAVDGVM